GAKARDDGRPRRPCTGGRAQAGCRTRADRALSLPAPRVGRPAALIVAAARHDRARGPDAGPGGDGAGLFIARCVLGRVSPPHDGGARSVHGARPVSRFYIVDGHSHLFRAYHAVGYLSTSKGVPSHAVLILSTMLWKLIREEQPEYLGIAWDPPGPTFRDHLFTDYKATRTAMPDVLVGQLPYVRRLFAALRTPVVEVSGYEADDVLATLVDKALALDVDEVVIITGDKDLLQLVAPRVRVVSVLGRTGEKVVYDEAKVRERWGVDPTQIVDVLALMGDSIDNIPGVHGVGEQTAVNLISQYGTAPRLYDNLTLVTGKLRETLAAGRKNALLSRELASLNHDVPVAFDLEAFRRAEPDWTKLRALWMEMEFTRLLKELPAPPVPVLSSNEPVARVDAATDP